jgi:hypothetical protein
VSDTCSCCRRPWEVCDTFSGRCVESQSRDAICAQCFDHQGFAMRSDPEHIELWRSFLERQQQEHQAVVAQLRGRIIGLEQELRERPEKVVERYIDADELQAARAEADRAFRSRQMAWQALVEIRLLHREIDNGMCRCSMRVDRCPIAEIVARYPALARWEKEQYERLRRDESHALPENHPAVLDPRWRPAD